MRRTPRGRPVRPPARGAALALAAMALGLSLPVGGVAQEQEKPRPGPEAPFPEPAMATAPKQFRIAATAGALTWEAESERGTLGDGALFGLEIERRIGPYLAFRVSGGYGRSTASNDTAAVDLNQYLIDVTATPRLALGPLRRAGVVPFGAIGLGAVVHDPEGADLVTKSQSAVAFGGGIDADLSATFGLRAEWRRYVVDTEDLFDPTNRTGEGRTADRFYGGVFLKL